MPAESKPSNDGPSDASFNRLGKLLVKSAGGDAKFLERMRSLLANQEKSSVRGSWPWPEHPNDFTADASASS